MQNLMSSGVKAECGSHFNTYKEFIPIQMTLEGIDHPQPATPAQVDNPTANSFACQQLSQIMPIRVRGHAIVLLGPMLCQARPLQCLLVPLIHQEG